MIWRIVLHCIRFWLILVLASSQLTSDQQTQIVNLINQYRTSVYPQSANMQRMVWDAATSQVAVNYAAQCIWDHNPNVLGILGESLFMTLGPLSVDQTIGIWYNERINYNFNTNSCAVGQLCGDYTQMIWANTNFIGCAAQFCSNVTNFNAQNATILVCNYYPPGNILGQSPYQAGPVCSACSSGTLGCVNNACDRGTNITSGLSAALIASLSATGNLGNITTGNSSGFTKPSVATLLFGGLIAFYIRMT